MTSYLKNSKDCFLIKTFFYILGKAFTRLSPSIYIFFFNLQYLNFSCYERKNIKKKLDSVTRCLQKFVILCLQQCATFSPSKSIFSALITSENLL